MKHKLLTLIVVVLGLFAQASAVESIPLEQVSLLEGPFKHAQDLNTKVLLEYDVDRLLAPYLKEAGLEPKAESYPNWIGLDGHIGGHYLTAMAMNYAATGNAECRKRMDYMVDQLAECQKANGNGYCGGVPGSEELWELVKTGDPAAVTRRWVPWYNLHKTYAGLRDAYLYGHNEKAKEVLIKFADWADELLADFSAEQMERMMDTEYGGMNEVFADVFDITGDKKYLRLAQRFSHRQLLDPMSKGVDSLDNRHANTQVPKAVGFQRIAELGGPEKFADAAEFFWKTVVENRSLAFGGNSRREHFPTEDACKEFVEERQGPESCNTYNMLKLTEGLFRMSGDMKYADYYELAMLNHILSSQNSEHGGYVYFTPARPQHYRVYSAPNEAMWCCVGSGMENHTQYGRFIYSQADGELYVNLFVASRLNWKQGGLTITQQTSFPYEPKTKLSIPGIDKPRRFALKLRCPSWTRAGEMTFTLNGKPLTVQAKPGSYASIERVWAGGDTLEVSLPMHASLKSMPNVPEYGAIMYGPVLLAARTSEDHLDGLVADDSRWGQIAHGELKALSSAPVLVGSETEIIDNLKAVEGKPLCFTDASIRPDKYKKLVLEPFFQLHDSRYMMYWWHGTEQQYEATFEAERAAEKARLELDRLTIDRVVPGEQQPEADHNIKSDGSENGTWRNRYFRHAQAPASFSYELKVSGSAQMELLVEYWGNEGLRRTFDILIDGKLLVTENTVGKYNVDEFVCERYAIPAELVTDKEKITVMFKPHQGNWAGGIFDLRIVKSAP